MKTLPAETIKFRSNPHAGISGSLVSIIQRIESAIDHETRSIRSDAEFDIKESNVRKSRYLYELSKAMKGLGQRDLDPEHRAGILRLRAKLDENQQVILAHLNAVTEVANIIQAAIEKTEADGTYSAGEFGGATAR
jgi:hypothetical protein